MSSSASNAEATDFTAILSIPEITGLTQRCTLTKADLLKLIKEHKTSFDHWSTESITQNSVEVDKASKARQEFLVDEISRICSRAKIASDSHVNDETHDEEEERWNSALYRLQVPLDAEMLARLANLPTPMKVHTHSGRYRSYAKSNQITFIPMTEKDYEDMRKGRELDYGPDPVLPPNTITGISQ